MNKKVLDYQKVFNKFVQRFKKNKNVLAVMVFGSMVSGDLWEESDIDMFVIINEDLKDIKNIYITDNDIPVHIKLLSKKKLFFHNHNNLDGFIHRVFAGSRLVFSKDNEITLKYDNDRFYKDIDKNRWNLVYLGNYIKLLSTCKKYLDREPIYTAYSFMMKCVEEYSKLLVNASGYMINNNVINLAAGMNDEFKTALDRLIFSKDNLKEAMLQIINCMEKHIDKNIKDMTKYLLQFMHEKDALLSSEDIKNEEVFMNFNINFEDILVKLVKLNLVKMECRDYTTLDGTKLLKENVYYI